MKPADLARMRAQGREASRAGQLEAAREIFTSILEAAPDDLEALNVLAMNLVARREFANAQRLLQRALAIAPGDVPSRRNLGLAFLASAHAEAAERIFADILSEAPNYLIAHLYLAHALEQQSRTQEAHRHYQHAITRAQQAGQWRDDASTPPSLRDAVRHAVRFLRARRRTDLHELLAGLQRTHGTMAMRRIEAAVALYLGDARLPPGAQTATFLHVPGLAPTPYFPSERFPWYAAFESQTAGIRGELENLLRGGESGTPFLGDARNHFDSYLGSTADSVTPPRWDGLFFFRHGERMDTLHARCPTTSAALEAADLVRIPGYAPEILFSVLGPGSHIKPHTGVTNTRLVTHFPLIVPERCALRVHGQDHHWQEGRCVTFDDTFLHEAWNHSTELRVVLLFDVWHPDLTPAERDAITTLVTRIGELNAPTVPGMG